MTVLPCHQCCQTSLISQGSNGGETQFHPISPSYTPHAFTSYFAAFCSHKTWFSFLLLQCYLFVSHNLFFFLLSFSVSVQFGDLMFKAAPLLLEAHISHNLVRYGCFCHAVFLKLMFTLYSRSDIVLDLSPIRSQSLLCFRD